MLKANYVMTATYRGRCNGWQTHCLSSLPVVVTDWSMYIASDRPTCIPAAEYVCCSGTRLKVILMSLQGASRYGILLSGFYQILPTHGLCCEESLLAYNLKSFKTFVSLKNLLFQTILFRCKQSVEFFKHHLGTVTDFALPVPTSPISSEVSVSSVQQKAKALVHLSWLNEIFQNFASKLPSVRM